MIPVIQPVPTVSVVQRASEDMTRYAVYGDSTVARAAHRRYGIMAQFAVISGTGSMTFQSSRHTLAEERVKTISAVSLLVGQCSPDFAVTLQTSDFTNRKTYADIRKEMLQRSDAPADSTSVPTVCLVQWKRPRPIRQGTLLFEGQAEIYAVMLDGDAGVAVDNVALRGCSGTIFTQIDRTVMTASFRLLRVPLIVLQFGGNYMPSIHSTSDISGYMRLLCRQIAYFRTVAPDARLLFVGPSDMGQSRQGKIETWENLPALNDSLKRVMLSQDVAYWDMFHVMGGKNSMKQWVEHDPPLAVSDYIHFTSAGAQWMGRGLSRSLLAYYDFYRMRKQLDADFLDDTIRKGEEDDHE